jgi:superfamily II DNA/RNA helicase
MAAQKFSQSTPTTTTTTTTPFLVLLILSVSTLLLLASSIPTAEAFTVTSPILQQSRSCFQKNSIMTGRKGNPNNGIELHLSQAASGTTAGRNKEQELQRLAQTMKVSIPELKEALTKQRAKVEAGSEKAVYIDWMLNGAGAAPKSAAPAQNKNATVSDPNLLTKTTFADCPGLHPNSKRALTETMGLSSMTEIQEKTFQAGAAGKDVLGRARTGTGKTLAFLMPAVERVLSAGSPYKMGQNVGVLIVSPTRELASQIGQQAEQLLSQHKGLSVQVIFGGTNIKSDQTKLSKKLPTILVATPGRLLDHLQSTEVKVGGQGSRKFSAIMAETGILVLDETDRLLDMGFRIEISKVLKYLPSCQKRQTLLFSATIPPELKAIMAENMKKDYVEVDCINDKDAGSSTAQKVKQSHVILPSAGMDQYTQSVVSVVMHALDQKDEDNHKIVVFFTTARMVAFFSAIFNDGLNVPVIELHSKKSQSYRNKASDTFRNANKGVLFTSDVSARGVDYPDVTQVIQVSNMRGLSRFTSIIVFSYASTNTPFLFFFSLDCRKAESSTFIDSVVRVGLERKERVY